MSYMDTIQQGVITLLKSAVTGEALPLPEGFDLEAACRDLQAHYMAPLLYTGAVHCGIPREQSVMQQLFHSYCKALLVSEGQLRQLERIFAAFDAEGIDYMPLKGCKMKALYPAPELRMMGDADVLIRLEQYRQIASIMEGLGFVNTIESDHELVWRNKELYLELHKHLIPSYNKDFYAYFGNGWFLAKQHSGSRWSMTAEDELVFLFTHFSKHYRDGGIGCRHVLDLWMYLRANPNLDEAYVKGELTKLQLREFYENIRRLIDVWFADAATDEKTDYITSFIFSSGSWGKAESKSASVAVRDSHGGSFWKGRFAYLLRTAFPDLRTLRNKYTVLKKAPWLLPVVWFVRPFYKVLFEFNTLWRHKRNLKAMTEDALDDRRRSLKYVGLDYHF